MPDVKSTRAIATLLGWSVQATRDAAREMGGTRALAAFVDALRPRVARAWEEKRGLLRRVELATDARSRVTCALYWRSASS